ncbi:hypothetical protein DSO57_1030547 [Entomophthora muscae]|uniref:Uncharacterized protein n=1 Tax=Entomophthora muscae TaxID=34485 RepID=A0ACC2TZ33_9FUNG|nr:hypothetical protein DSO57_1030547 [Entomophthora muscae]
MIQFQKDESIGDFTDCFYLKVQVLTEFRSLTLNHVHIALCSKIKPYEALYCTLMPAFQVNFSIDGMVHYLCQYDNTFGPTNALIKPKPLLTFPACTEGNGQFAPKDNMSKVTYHCYNCKRHYANTYTLKTGVHILLPQDVIIQGKVLVE